MSSPVAPAALVEWAAAQACPACGTAGLTVDMRLTARPIGTFSLAGQQMKVSASWVPWIRCPGCGIEAEGKPA